MQYVVSLLFVSLCYFLITRLISFNILFIFVFLCVFCVFVLFCLLFLLLYIAVSFLFVQVYRPLPPAGNPFAVNEYHTEAIIDNGVHV